MYSSGPQFLDVEPILKPRNSQVGGYRDRPDRPFFSTTSTRSRTGILGIDMRPHGDWESPARLSSRPRVWLKSHGTTGTGPDTAGKRHGVRIEDHLPILI